MNNANYNNIFVDWIKEKNCHDSLNDYHEAIIITEEGIINYDEFIDTIKSKAKNVKKKIY